MSINLETDIMKNLKYPDFTLLFTLVCMALMSCSDCVTDEKREMEDIDLSSFDRSLWQEKEGMDYPNRCGMYPDILYDSSLRGASKDEILELMGLPDRFQENHFYYRIDQQRLGVWPLHTTTLVIKFDEDDLVEWIKIHR